MRRAAIYLKGHGVFRRGKSRIVTAIRHDTEQACFASCVGARRSPLSGFVTSGHELRRQTMTQTSNRFFDESARLMNDAAGAAQGVKREVDTVVRNQAERILRDLDLVKREEFEAVKDMARLAREENEALKARLDKLEKKAGPVAET
jgi:BMFP domain-containing protein YqiC